MCSVEKIQKLSKRKQESRAIAKKTARCALYMDALKNFGSPGFAHGYTFPKIVNGLLL